MYLCILVANPRDGQKLQLLVGLLLTALPMVGQTVCEKLPATKVAKPQVTQLCCRGMQDIDAWNPCMYAAVCMYALTYAWMHVPKSWLICEHETTQPTGSLIRWSAMDNALIRCSKPHQYQQ